MGSLLVHLLLLVGAPPPASDGDVKVTAQPQLPDLVDVTVVLRGTASRNEPQTALLLEEVDDPTSAGSLSARWNADALLKPADAASTRSAFMLVGADLELFP